MSKFKKCENCDIIVTKIKRSRFDNRRDWDAIRWQRPNDPGDPDKIVGHCNDGSVLKAINPVILLCKNCIECYDLLNLEIDLEKREWIVPQEIDKILGKKTNRGSGVMEENKK